jgi:hypothetical protein
MERPPPDGCAERAGVVASRWRSAPPGALQWCCATPPASTTRSRSSVRSHRLSPPDHRLVCQPLADRGHLRGVPCPFGAGNPATMEQTVDCADDAVVCSASSASSVWPRWWPSPDTPRTYPSDSRPLCCVRSGCGLKGRVGEYVEDEPSRDEPHVEGTYADVRCSSACFR